MAISSDVALQRLWRTQFPSGSPPITVRNTFIYVEDMSPRFSTRRPQHSKTLHATMPTSSEVFTGITDVDGQESQKAMDKKELTLSATSTAGSETGMNDSFDTVSVASDQLCNAWPSGHSMPLGLADTPTQKTSSTPMQMQQIVDDGCSPRSPHNQKHISAPEMTYSTKTQEPLCRSSILRPSSERIQSEQRIGIIPFGAELLAHGSEDSAAQTSIGETVTVSITTQPAGGKALTNVSGECIIETSLGEASSGKASLLCSMSTSSSAMVSQSSFQAPLTESVPPFLKIPEAPTTHPKVMTWTQCKDACCFNICWTLDARKVRGNDKQAVSPPVELPLAPGGRHVKFRIMIFPRPHVLQSMLSFKTSRSRGFIQIKCESDKSCQTIPVRFTLSVGSGHHAQGSRGPVDHDFATNGICGLPKGPDIWDFFSATETRSMTVSVFLALTRIENVQSFPVPREIPIYTSKCLRLAH